MARVNVFLPEPLLRAVDEEARLAGSRRSAFIQAALGEYLEGRRRGREQAEAQRRMDDACRTLDAIADRLGDWDPAPAIRRGREARKGVGAGRAKPRPAARPRRRP